MHYKPSLALEMVYNGERGKNNTEYEKYSYDRGDTTLSLSPSLYLPSFNIKAHLHIAMIICPLKVTYFSHLCII